VKRERHFSPCYSAVVHLYAAFLGGPVADGRMGEDHEVVFVVADDPIDAKSKAKDKWSGVGRGHVDAVQRVEIVDGFAISLEPAPQGGTVTELVGYN
jgi:Domain of Unknown Function (DUF1543)